ncbi:MAG: type II toxin-antitoxin system HipA family toxin [Sphaerochaetaceae bacterium]|nr:type II toxin-antitoxin system HipA family toxin [Sphaerochaetaceae bacterium]
MNNYKLNVIYHNSKVGTLIYTNHLASFQYDTDWIANGFSISPFSLPLSTKIFTPSFQPFDGLFGIFNDSLPDGWGYLLMDRIIKQNKVDTKRITPLYRLSILGSSTLGALEYKPNETIYKKDSFERNLDEINEQCKLILNNEKSDSLDYLFKNAGSSNGENPKIFKRYNNEDWIIKFANSQDSNNIGIQEYEYSLCAKKCGIQIPNTHLFESNNCPGYFGIKRFDRKDNTKIHMASASALLETSHRLPNLDYLDLLKLTFYLTKDISQVKQMYKLMCFNVFSHNRDDHSKNFSFLYDDDKWQVSPAYDLTYSNSFNGEHATTINGEGANPTKRDLLQVGLDFGLDTNFCKLIIDKIEDIVKTDLAKYL